MDEIVADTSFLLSQFEYGIDLPGELLRITRAPFTLIIPSAVRRELEMLAGRTGRRAAAARFALSGLPKFAARFPVKEEPSEGRADDWIFKYAQENRVAVATNDVPLRRRISASGVPVIGVKGKSKLDFV